jgi:hypothetical protein
MQTLNDAGLIEAKYPSELRDLGIILRTNMQRNCKKRELMQYQ